eukprot:13054664-Alexandrium_andersonii.AAC.1
MGFEQAGKLAASMAAAMFGLRWVLQHRPVAQRYMLASDCPLLVHAPQGLRDCSVHPRVMATACAP